MRLSKNAVEKDFDSHYLRSSYNEGTDERQDFYIMKKGNWIYNMAFLHSYPDREFSELEVIRFIVRSHDEALYDSISGDTILSGEYDVDIPVDFDYTAEFVDDDDCYFVWFKSKPNKTEEFDMIV